MKNSTLPHACRVVVCCTTSVLVAAIAVADPFEVPLPFQAGGGLAGVPGEGFQPSKGNFFKSIANPGPVPPPFSFFHVVPELEFDTYVSIDAIGPSGRAGSVTDLFYGFGEDHEVNGPSTRPFSLRFAHGSHITVEAAMIGISVSPLPFLSGLAPDGADGVFILRGTVDPGASIVGGGVLNIDGLDVEDTAAVNLDGTTVRLDGQKLTLVAYLVADPSHNGGLGDTYDVWLQIAPPCEGDANDDGVVDHNDIITVVRNWQANHTPGTRPTGRGVANIDDLRSVLDNWLTVCP